MALDRERYAQLRSQALARLARDPLEAGRASGTVDVGLVAVELDPVAGVGEMRLSSTSRSVDHDFALQPMDSDSTADIYELIVERHRAAATVVTSNREPVEWLALMADPLLAQSAIDRLQSAAHELVLDGQSCRQHPPAGPVTRHLHRRSGYKPAHGHDEHRGQPSDPDRFHLNLPHSAPTGSHPGEGRE